MNTLYTEYKNAMLGAWAHSFPDLDTDNIKAALIDHTDALPDPATDVDYDDIDDGTVVAVSSNLTGASVSAGTVNFDDITFSGVSGDAADSLNFFKDSGTPATSPLLVFIDTATGLPVVPTGGDIQVVLNHQGLFGL